MFSRDCVGLEHVVFGAGTRARALARRIATDRRESFLLRSDAMSDGPQSIQVIDEEATIRAAFRLPIGAAALDASAEAVVVDVRMPIEDILAFVRQLRADPNHAHTPVTVITDEYVSDNSVRVEIARLEVTLCLKPPDPEHVPQFATALLMLKDEF